MRYYLYYTERSYNLNDSSLKRGKASYREGGKGWDRKRNKNEKMGAEGVCIPPSDLHGMWVI